MKKQNVETVLRELANQNFNAYPEDYPRTEGEATDEATERAQDLALDYWENRNEHEIKRDDNLAVSKIDYVEWVCAEFSEWVQEQNDNADFLKNVPDSL